MSKTDIPPESLNPLGYRRLSPYWAKAEIMLGLTAAGVGLLLDRLMEVPAGAEPGPVLARLALIVLGGYLALAGQRSHFYQSLNQQTAALLVQMRRSQPNG
jgi:hypothetical protein